MMQIKFLNASIKLILLTLCLSACCLKAEQLNEHSYAENDKIKNWFNDEALKYDSENLHHGSAWRYLTTEQFKEMVLDSISKMDPQIGKDQKIFELGVGVGAALKVIETHIGADHLEIGGSDIAENAIKEVKKIFPNQSDHFFVHNMTQKHNNIPDNYYDHVLSFGALAMYLTKDEMKKAIKEAVRITKPGGSLLMTSFIAPGGENVGSIITAIEPSFFEENAKEWRIENIKIYEMKHQGDRYQVTFRKSRPY